MVVYLACEMRGLRFSLLEYRCYAVLGVTPCNLVLYQITLRHIAEFRKMTQLKCWVCSVSNLKTALLIQKTHVHKISILIYLRLLEAIFIQICIIMRLNLRLGRKRYV